MSHPIVFTTNSATIPEIAAHLSRCDMEFVPPLRNRADIDGYARKIGLHAERFEAWADKILVGLVAAYCNDPDRQLAFVSSVSVEPGYRRQGLASELMDRCIARAEGFERIDLEVDVGNAAALDLYEKHGFAVSATRSPTLVMSLIASGE